MERWRNDKIEKRRNGKGEIWRLGDGGMANGVNERRKVGEMEKWKYWKMDRKRDWGIKRFNKI